MSLEPKRETGMARNGTPAAKWVTLRRGAKTVFLPSYNTNDLDWWSFYGSIDPYDLDCGKCPLPASNYSG